MVLQLPPGITGSERCRSSPSPSPAREAGGFGRLRGKTNALPQISSSHSLELVLAKTPPSGDSTEARANHTSEERGPRRGGGGRVGGSTVGAQGQRLSLSGNAVPSAGTEGQGVLAPLPGPGRILSFPPASQVLAEAAVSASSQRGQGCLGKSTVPAGGTTTLAGPAPSQPGTVRIVAPRGTPSVRRPTAGSARAPRARGWPAPPWPAGLQAGGGHSGRCVNRLPTKRCV